MFALARFAVRIAQLYVGFGIAGIGLIIIAKGLISGLTAFIMVPVGLVVLWVAHRVVAAMERVAEALREAGRD